MDPDTEIVVQAVAEDIDVALNNCRNKIYLVTLDPRFNSTGGAGVTIIMSNDGGKTWSDPVPVNPNTLDVQTFLPSVAVLEDGTVGVMFYDFRFFKSGDISLKTDVWLALFDENLTHWLGEIRLTDESFDSRQFLRRVAPGSIYDNALFIGDYVKMIAYKNTFLSSFCISNPPYGVGPAPPANKEFRLDERAGVIFPNRQDVVFRKVKINNHCCDKNLNIKSIKPSNINNNINIKNNKQQLINTGRNERINAIIQQKKN